MFIIKRNDLNYYLFFLTLVLLTMYIKHTVQCFVTFPEISSKILLCVSDFLTVVWKCGKTRSFNILGFLCVLPKSPLVVSYDVLLRTYILCMY